MVQLSIASAENNLKHMNKKQKQGNVIESVKTYLRS